MKLPSPSIFLEAARLIGEEQQPFACNALWTASGRTIAETAENPEWFRERDVLPAVRYFTALLRPKTVIGDEAWYGNYSDYYPVYCLDNRSARIMGLTLCALLVKEGFIPPGFKP